MNSKLILEFEKLQKIIINENKKFKEENNKKGIITNNFRLKYIFNIIAILKNLDFKLTKDNYLNLKDYDGVGKGILTRVEEFLNTGYFEETKNFKEDKEENNKQQIIDELKKVINIGESNALDLVNKGITSVKDLKKKIKKGEINVNDKIKLGLKYYGIVQDNIPRKEIDEYNKILNIIIDELNKDNIKPYYFEIAGSYRRQKPISGDIDVLFSKKGVKDNKSLKYLEKIINILKSNIKENNNKPLLIDDLTEDGDTKYMGFSKLKDNNVRRIDIRFIDDKSFHSALLYFTGSYELNKQMRKKAISMGLKLSEYGLFEKVDDEWVKIKTKTEKDIFKKLEMDYIEPRYR
ncbi:putative DNA polymerase family X protein [Chlorella virus XW01]|nr:putative DNA polymerase family X protein [Chlorella virus XW01]